MKTCSMRSRFTMTSSYESYSRLLPAPGLMEPDVGTPHILKRILRISLLARTVNREPALFWANHGPCGSYRSKTAPLLPACDHPEVENLFVFRGLVLTRFISGNSCDA